MNVNESTKRSGKDVNYNCVALGKAINNLSECSYGFCKKIILQTDTVTIATCNLVSDYDFEDIGTLAQSKRINNC